MKKLPILIVAVILTVGLFSCKKICVRCENGLTGDIQNECFLDDGERQTFVDAREAVGYSCTDAE